MELSLIGYGKMGQAIDTLARKKKWQVTHRFSTTNKIREESLLGTIGVDFTNALAFRKNYRKIAEYCTAAVVGTTGWDDIRDQVCDYFTAQNKTLIYAENFSLGANFHFMITKYASRLVANSRLYAPYLLEMHHREKKDQPSGTARALGQDLQTVFQQTVKPASIRTGWIRGIHEIGYESEVDKIIIRHEAYSRDGFAQGVIAAIEWTIETSGVWHFRELLMKKFAI